jgi:hypothetical protein
MGQTAFTVADHLLGKDATIVALYERFVPLVEACGPFEYVIGKDAITFKGQRRIFASAKPKARSLNGLLVLQRQVQDPRIRTVSPFTKRVFGHQFRVTELDQLDEAFTGWVREAYQVGQGQHLTE